MEPEIIKATRLKLKLTQSELGQAMGVGAAQVSKWESGKHKMSRRYVVQIKDLFSSMILSPEDQADYMEMGEQFPAWVEDPGLDSENMDFDEDELTKTKKMLHWKEFAEENRPKDPYPEDIVPDEIDDPPTMEEDGFKIDSRTLGKIIVRNNEGHKLTMKWKRFLEYRKKEQNPFEHWPVKFSTAGPKNPKVKKSGFGEFSHMMDQPSIGTPQQTSKEVESFINCFLKDALKEIKPQKFDAWLKEVYEQKGGLLDAWMKIQRELDKISEEKKDQIMQDAFDSQSKEMIDMITEAFSTERAQPLVKLINDKIKDGVADYQFTAKSEVARLEAMIQKEAKDKILEYRKEIGILEDKLKDRDNTIQLMQENIDQLKQIIQNHKAMTIAGIPEAIVGEDITARAFAKTTVRKILEDNKEEK